MTQNKTAAVAFRAFSFAFALAGLMAQLGLFRGELHYGAFMYYTIQSNLLALVMFGILGVKTAADIKKNGKTGDAGYHPRFEMVVVIDLLLTLIVYWVLLAPSSFSMAAGAGLWTFSNLAVHLVTPLLCLADYLLFNAPGQLLYRDVYAVLIYPLLYVVFSSAAGLLGYVYRYSVASGRAVRFPYFFFDWDELGAAALLYIAALVLFFLVLSHALYWVDKKRAQSGK